MPIDPDVAIGAEVGAVDFQWSSSDVLLYHLAVGAGSRPGDNLSADALRWTLDNDALQVLPSFAVVAPSFHETNPPGLELPGCDINLAQVVHGAQEVHLSGPVPTSGSARLTTHITDVWDKGKAAVIWQEGVATDPAGTELWRVRSSIFVKGEGGWGGNRGESTAVTVPDRPADASTTYTVTPQQALLYRLCGDRNPLHADPAFAETAGFPGADPARTGHLRHRAARGHRSPARRRRVGGGRLLGPVRRCRVPRRDPHRERVGRARRHRGDRHGRRRCAARTGRLLGDSSLIVPTRLESWSRARTHARSSRTS